MPGNPVRWFELYVQDMPRARAFYETVLGVALSKLDGPGIEMWTFARDDEAHGASGALVKAPGVASGGGGTMVYFGCEDCALPESRVAAAGGRVARPKLSIGAYGFVTLAVDTEGNLIGFHSPK